MIKVIVITGPTATGKTALGVRLAKALGGEVISADSMQIYKYMDIGTAKPSEAEMQGVPHHMLSIVPPWESYSAARYVQDASQCVADIAARGKLPVLVGGTGLYIDSLLSGRDFALRGDVALRRELELDYDELGGGKMLMELARFDPESAERLHQNDKKRIVRAFEVYRLTGMTISEHDRKTKSMPPRYDAVKLALTFADRQRLYERINSRAADMFEAGLESEVQKLLDMGVSRESTAMQAIGYKETAEALLGICTADEAVERIKMESRRYAKRQLTWLRRDNSVNWITWEKTPDLDLGLLISTGYLQNS